MGLKNSLRIIKKKYEQKFFYGRHFIDKKDIRSVTKSLESSLSQGPILEKFEKEVSRFFGSKYCVAFSSATAALHVAIASLKLKKILMLLPQQ